MLDITVRLLEYGSKLAAEGATEIEKLRAELRIKNTLFEQSLEREAELENQLQTLFNTIAKQTEHTIKLRDSNESFIKVLKDVGCRSSCTWSRNKIEETFKKGQ